MGSPHPGGTAFGGAAPGGGRGGTRPPPRGRGHPRWWLEGLPLTQRDWEWGEAGRPPPRGKKMRLEGGDLGPPPKAGTPILRGGGHTWRLGVPRHVGGAYSQGLSPEAGLPPPKNSPRRGGGGHQKARGGWRRATPPRGDQLHEGQSWGHGGGPTPRDQQDPRLGVLGPPRGGRGLPAPPSRQTPGGGGPVPPPSEKKGSGKQQLLTPPSPLRGTRRGKGPENRFGEGARDGEGRRGWVDAPPPCSTSPAQRGRGAPLRPPPPSAREGGHRP